jgi:hypothetical protein
MTTSRSSWCWNTWHVYELDLLWVWSGWDASIMTYSIIQVRNQENHLQLPVTVRPSISGWGYILMTASRSIRCGNTLYVYGEDLTRVWGGWSASIITYSMIQVNMTVNPRGWGYILTTYSRSSRCWIALHIWSWSSMSLNWVGCLLHQNPSEKPRESPMIQLPVLWDPDLARPREKSWKVVVSQTVFTSCHHDVIYGRWGYASRNDSVHYRHRYDGR